MDFRRKTQALPAPLKVYLSEEEDKKLLEFQKIDGIPRRVRERAEMIRLNHHGWSVEKIAKYKQKSTHTVRASLHRWATEGLEGLWEEQGRGRKRSWLETDIEYLETWIEKDPRTYNSKQLAQKLKQDRGVTLSSDRIRKLLKKRGGDGKEPGINNRTPVTPNTNKLI